MKKVNLGCGPYPAAGWINIDNSILVTLSKFPIVPNILHSINILNEKDYANMGKWKQVKRVDVTDGIPFSDNSIDYYYTSHLLEHLEREEAEFVCRECYRTLKEGGVLRVVVPDLRLLAEKYIESDYGFYVDEEGPIADRFLKKTMLADFHNWMYDEESLFFLLLEAGFSGLQINEREYEVGKCPDLPRIETHEPPTSIYMEAVK